MRLIMGYKHPRTEAVLKIQNSLPESSLLKKWISSINELLENPIQQSKLVEKIFEADLETLVSDKILGTGLEPHTIEEALDKSLLKYRLRKLFRYKVASQIFL